MALHARVAVMAVAWYGLYYLQTIPTIAEMQLIPRKRIYHPCARRIAKRKTWGRMRLMGVLSKDSGKVWAGCDSCEDPDKKFT